MAKPPQIRLPAGLSPKVPESGVDAERAIQDLATLREIVAGLERLEETLDHSPIPHAVAVRGYFTPDEDDRVRQGLLAYRNYRLAAYEIIWRYRHYAALEDTWPGAQTFLLAFGAALVLYAKSLKIISFAEHEPLLRAKLNEPDPKFELAGDFFDDVVAGYSQLRNFKAIRQADAFWRSHRHALQAFANEAGPDWVWLTALIRRQRKVMRGRLVHVLLKRLRHDWRAFGRSVLSPVVKARRGLEHLIGDRLADVQVTGPQLCAIGTELLTKLPPLLRPGDVLLMRNDSRLTAALLPGFWTHAALYVGGRADLEALGLKSHHHAGRCWERIPEAAGSLGLVLEAVFPCVQLNPLEKCLQVDHLAIFRPTLPSGEIGAALGEALGHLDKPYDFEFDFNNTSRVVCTELVYRSYHNRGGISFSLTKRLGRFTLSGDDIVSQVLPNPAPTSGPTPWEPVGLILKLRDGRAHFCAPDRVLPLLRRLRRGWRPTRRLNCC